MQEKSDEYQGRHDFEYNNAVAVKEFLIGTENDV